MTPIKYRRLQNINKGQITQDLESWLNGSQQAGIRIFQNAYSRLVLIAGAQRKNIADITLSANDVVHEAYSRLLSAMENSKPENSLQFYRLSAHVFRLTCIDYLRSKMAHKRDAQSVNHETLPYTKDDENLLQIFMLLEELEKNYHRQADVFELNKIIGFSLQETAELTGSSKATVSRDINFARHWLASRL